MVELEHWTTGLRNCNVVTLPLSQRYLLYTRPYVLSDFSQLVSSIPSVSLFLFLFQMHYLYPIELPAIADVFLTEWNN